MGHEDDPPRRVTFGDVLVARRYLRQLQETGKLSPDLQAAVEQHGVEHVERLASIIAKSDQDKAYIRQRAHELAARVVSRLKAKRELVNKEQEGSLDLAQSPPAPLSENGPHE